MTNQFEKITPENMFDSGDLKILICYLLTALSEPVPVTETAQLFHYEGISNYFDTQTAIAELERDGYITVSEKAKDLYEITPKGISLSNTLKDTVSTALRTKVYNAVLKMLLRYKTERDTNITIEKTEGGALLTCKVENSGQTLFSFQLLLPGVPQAQALKTQILEDPKYYYDSFIKTLTDGLKEKKGE